MSEFIDFIIQMGFVIGVDVKQELLEGMLFVFYVISLIGILLIELT